ncbi:SDR family oxidoreductase [Marinitoga sp. 38H-ov]|uniref:SDR family oxidoreductase n=1 Tax=Marinitoga sp. 38H-ov TaxID=1755814 RepID=UPI0019D1FD25|nr:SDR family oxidoreductase [Marinitoga sp. 38H-ov]
MSKLVVISGGANNIGKGIAFGFLNEGWNVAIIDNNIEALKKIKEPNLFKFFGDVSNEDDIKKFYNELKIKYKRLDVIINNAAIGGFKNFFELTLNDWKKVIDVNLTGYFLMVKYGAPLMLDCPGKGSIINISSTRAIMSEPGNEAYSSSKAGILGLTHALANSLGPNIRVNAISPGWILHENEQVSEIEHKQHLVGRAGYIQDIFNLVLFLSENKSEFITGQNFVIDGGMTKKMTYI